MDKKENNLNTSNQVDSNFEDVLNDLKVLVEDAIKNRNDNPDDYLPPSTILDPKKKELVLLPKNKK